MLTVIARCVGRLTATSFALFGFSYFERTAPSLSCHPANRPRRAPRCWRGEMVAVWSLEVWPFVLFDVLLWLKPEDPPGLGHPHPAKPAVQLLDVMRFDRNLPESFVHPGLAPGWTRCVPAKKLRIAWAKSRNACCCTIWEPAASRNRRGPPSTAHSARCSRAHGVLPGTEDEHDGVTLGEDEQRQLVCALTRSWSWCRQRRDVGVHGGGRFRACRTAGLATKPGPGRPQPGGASRRPRV
uniref:Uncharacterized protein n=1 Tax=Mycobacterium riyadhense TaxID=486698 RepID=A0A653F2H9_9MYCO|nr:hypothetical protein BIN_B_05277 [Mycobacterium riyadhense]